MEDDDIVVDFAIRRDACLDLFRGWESKLWFAPTDLKSSSTIRQLKALFLPYWLFEVETSSRYILQALCNSVTEFVEIYCDCSILMFTRYTGMSAVNIGAAKHLTSWSHFAGTNVARHRYAVCATDCFEHDLVSKIEPWKLDDIRNAEIGIQDVTPTGSSSSSRNSSCELAPGSDVEVENPPPANPAEPPQPSSCHPARACSPVTRTQV